MILFDCRPSQNKISVKCQLSKTQKYLCQASKAYIDQMITLSYTHLIQTHREEGPFLLQLV